MLEKKLASDSFPHDKCRLIFFNHHDEAGECHVGDSPREAHVVVHPTAHGRSKEVPVITWHFTINFIFLFLKIHIMNVLCVMNRQQL